MFHGLNNDFLYTAFRLESTFEDSIGKTISFSGTAFAIPNAKGTICLITNRHCIEPDFKQPTPKYADFKMKSLVIHTKIKDLTTGLPTLSYDISITNFVNFKFHSDNQNDVACLKPIQGRVIKNPSATTIKIDFFIPYSFVADKGQIEKDLSVCDFVAFPGYPPWYDMLRTAPILRTGTIASDPRYDYSWDGNHQGACIGYEAFSYGGSSGSPVFAVEKGINVGPGLSGGGYRRLLFIGINAGHLSDPKYVSQHSGISYLYKSWIIKELIDAP